MPRTTPSVRLAGLLLGEDLGAWVTRRRRSGDSWDTVADALALATRDQVTLSSEWLRRLYAASADRVNGGAA
jgi:hypothetical protein